jgi:DNA-binding GntR family transcriptional regulator
MACLELTMPKARVVRDEPHRSSAYESLRELIIRGNLAPGVRLVELDVATRLGISRTPAREAIQRLHQDGFLVTVGGGSRTQLAVAPLSVDDMRDLYSIMGSLEGSAARRVAGLTTTDRTALARRMKEANDRFVAQVKIKTTPDMDRQFEHHNAFHDELVAATASPRLRELIDRVRPHLQRYEYVYAPMVGGTHEETLEEHAAIIRAVRDGTATAAEGAVRANWLNSGERLQKAMGVAGPRGVW